MVYVQVQVHDGGVFGGVPGYDTVLGMVDVPLHVLERRQSFEKWFRMVSPKGVRLKSKLKLRLRYVKTAFSSGNENTRRSLEPVEEFQPTISPEQSVSVHVDESADDDAQSSVSGAPTGRHHIQEILANDFSNESRKAAYGVGMVILSTLRHWMSNINILVLSFVMMGVSSCVVPLQAKYSQILTDEALRVDVKTEATYTVMCHACLALCVLYIVRMVAQFSLGCMQAYIVSRAAASVRKRLMLTVLQADVNFHQENSKGGLGALFAGDVARITAMWNGFFWNLLNPIFSLTLAFGYLFLLDTNAAMMGLGFLSIVFAAGPKILAAELSRDFSNFNAEVHSEYRNNLHCYKVVQSYGIIDSIMRTFNRSLIQLRGKEFLSIFWASNMQLSVESLLNFFTTVQSVALAFFCYHGHITLGEFVSMVQLYTSIVKPASQLGSFSRNSLTHAGSLQRIDDVIYNTKIKSQPSSQHKHSPRVSVTTNSRRGESEDSTLSESGFPASQLYFDSPQNASRQFSIASGTTSAEGYSEELVKFQNVSFRYTDQGPLVLRDISFGVGPGSYVCLVGPSGSGKSTILSILLRFQIESSGCIFFDRKPLSDTNLNKEMAVVFQDVLIFNGHHILHLLNSIITRHTISCQLRMNTTNSVRYDLR